MKLVLRSLESPFHVKKRYHPSYEVTTPGGLLIGTIEYHYGRAAYVFAQRKNPDDFFIFSSDILRALAKRINEKNIEERRARAQITPKEPLYQVVKKKKVRL
jgi:hypothetical protein